MAPRNFGLELVTAGRPQDALEETERALLLVPDTTGDSCYAAIDLQLHAQVALGRWDDLLGVIDVVRLGTASTSCGGSPRCTPCA